MKNVIIYLLLLSIISCKKYKLNEFEKEMYNVYKVGDTMVFSSIKTKKTKKYVITEKVNYIDSDIDGRFRVVEVYYRDLDIPIIIDPLNHYKPELFSIYKDKYGNRITIKFNDFYGNYENNFGAIKTDTIFFLNKKYCEYYTLNPTISYTEDSTTMIYWQKGYGIVKFDLKSGDSYERTNMP